MPLHIRPLLRSEADTVVGLIRRSFAASAGPLYELVGRDEFAHYIQPEALMARLDDRHVTLVAVDEKGIVGMIELRDLRHVALFFVDSDRQRVDIGKRLWKEALRRCLAARPDLAVITVHSSPNAIAAYEAMGFRPTGEMRTTDGITFLPMAFATEVGAIRTALTP